MNVIPLHAANPGPFTGEGNWTYLIDGTVPVLIDAGVGNVPHLDAIDAAAGGSPLHLVVTHAHSDHISGAPSIVERRPATRLSKMLWTERDRDLPWQPLQDGDVITTGEGDLQVLHTPGHAPDHVCLWHAASRTVFVGDMLVQGTTVMIPASHRGSLLEYLQSLDRLLALNARRALPAHGPPIEDPAARGPRIADHRRVAGRRPDNRGIAGAHLPGVAAGARADGPRKPARALAQARNGRPRRAQRERVGLDKVRTAVDTPTGARDTM
jgi:glyoxylase-like metal-dependent hydrolase (beta-lactamase superfamily II)